MSSTPSAQQIGQQPVELCQQGKHLEALDALYSDSIVSVEPVTMDPTKPATSRGIEAVRGKNKWWLENHEVHGGQIKGPFPHGKDRFACFFAFDCTHKPSGQRMQMEEVALYTVKNGKIQQEEFFYNTPAG